MAADDIGGDFNSLWRDDAASGQRAMVAEILAQVSMEALEGTSLETMLQRIVNYLAQRLPVAIASIILLNEERTHFVQEVWAGSALELPGDLPWPVTLGASGRCVLTGQAQLIADVNLDSDYVPGNADVQSE